MTQLRDQPELLAVTDFLRHCLPFDSLSEKEFQLVANQLEIVYFRRGEIFDGKSNDASLRIVRSGAVEIRDGNNKLLDRLGESESFNIVNLSKASPGARAILIEDTLIYQLTAADYQQLRETNREFDRFFNSQRDRRLRRAVRYEASTHQMMTPVSTLMSKNVLTLSRQDSLEKAAQAMTDKRVSSALVMCNEKVTGIITDRDLRSRAIAKNLPANTTVETVMTRDPCSIGSSATVFDATLLMSKTGCHHLPVVEHDKLMGIITTSDLMLAKQNDPLYLIQRISRQTDVFGLKAIVETMPNLLVEWAAAGMKAGQISHILTTFSDAVTARLIEMAIDHYGPAPVAFCWLGFGSQARSEQLIGADQDNGLIISDDLQEADKPWFKNLASYVCDGLNVCGYVYCPGNVMATNDEWRQPLATWRTIVDRWTRSPTPAAVMRVSIFFDLRSIYGDASLCQQLQQFMLDKTSNNSIFLAALAANVLEHTPPLGVFRRFLVERNGDHKETLDLKKRGVIPIIDMIRIHSLANKIEAVNTGERISELMQRNILSITDARNLQDALDFIMQLRTNEQARQVSSGEEVNNYCNPKHLPELSRKHLRDAFTVVHESQEALRKNYRGGF